MHTAIGAEERKLLSDVLGQSLPAEMADLPKQLDQLMEAAWTLMPNKGEK
jgi:hypothetical protein